MSCDVLSVLSAPGSSGDSGIMQPVARQHLCKHGDYATIKEALFSVMRCPFLGYISRQLSVDSSIKRMGIQRHPVQLSYEERAMGSRKLVERNRSAEEYTGGRPVKIWCVTEKIMCYSAVILKCVNQ
jgi:hypothetical protein